jgi:predicted TIM-barrel fold metal-dependent hydrolase
MHEFWRIIDRVAPRGWHVVLHFDAVDLPAYADDLDRLPVPYVIDHLARIDAARGLDQEPFARLCELLHDERAWVKISGAERLSAAGPPGYADVVPYARAVIDIAPDRVLWGTDWPHPNVRQMPDDGDLVDVLAAFAPDEATRTRILVDNPAKLYDFG